MRRRCGWLFWGRWREGQSIAAPRSDQVSSITENQFALRYSYGVACPMHGVCRAVRRIDIRWSIKAGRVQSLRMDVAIVPRHYRVLLHRGCQFGFALHSTRHHGIGIHGARRAVLGRRLDSARCLLMVCATLRMVTAPPRLRNASTGTQTLPETQTERARWLRFARASETEVSFLRRAVCR
jgi:hypothetical protein